MLLLCYITLSIPESSIFFFVLHNHVTYDYDIYDYPMTSVILPLYFMTCMTIIYDITLHFFIYVTNFIQLVSPHC